MGVKEKAVAKNMLNQPRGFMIMEGIYLLQIIWNIKIVDVIPRNSQTDRMVIQRVS